MLSVSIYSKKIVKTDVLREHIKNLLENRLKPAILRVGQKKRLTEYGDVTTSILNNNPVYPDGATHFPYFDKPKTPEELGALSNRNNDLNTDQQADELYLNRDTVSPTPVLPGNDGATIIPYREYR